MMILPQELRALPHGRSESAWSASIHVRGKPRLHAPSASSADGSLMNAYQGFRLFSHVVLALMCAGIVYAAYIAVTYWTGISV